MLPNTAVLEVLERAYAPCEALRGACSEMRWAPRAGRVPRGFTGAFGELAEVKLVLVMAEPGDPHLSEAYPDTAAPREILESACRYAYSALDRGADLFHRNLRHILDLCWPDSSLVEQLHHSWLTDSVLCSAIREGAPVPGVSARECRTRYLDAQLDLFPGATVVALGGKAQQRLRGRRDVLHAFAVAPPGCNRREAWPSWESIAARFRNT